MDATSDIQPRLNGFDTAMIVVSLIIGAGIFRTPSEVALQAGQPSVFWAAWVLGGLTAVLGALVFAEIGARRPVAGGYYALIAECFGVDAAFMINWTMVIVSGVSLAAVTTVGVDYLAPLLSPEVAALDRRLLGGGLLLALYGLNLRGIRVGATVQNVLSGLKVVLILGVALMALVAVVPGSAPTAVQAAAAEPDRPLFLTLGAAMVPVFFTFGGYHMVTNVGADVRNPQRNIPLGVLGGVGVVFSVYLLINLAYVRVLSMAGVAASTKVAGDLAGALFGPWGDRLISGLVFVSVLGFMNVAFLHMPRTYLAMANSGVLPAPFARVNPRTQVQDFGLTFYVVTILIALVFLEDFGRMLDFVMFIDLLAVALLASTLFVLRRRRVGEPTPDGPRPYRVPLYPWLPLAFTGCLLAVVTSVFLNDVFVHARYHTLVSLGLLAAGWPLSRLMQRVSAPSSADA